MTMDGTLCAMDKRSLTQVASRFREAEVRAEILRQELAVAIRQADADGVTQKDICEATGYTRQQVRRIVKAGDGEDAEAVAPE
ncbi:MarR family transcriptional regulator [Streptomyces sediminimaris]|uniref:MarR family transcriptional regulator n=1 Tax=Streptomyces sediminimaris TaxID=3383721 RepID=UPI00399B83A1